MKRIFTYMAMMLVAAGCTMDRKVEYDPLMEFEFLPVMHVAAKADVVEDYPEGEPFAVNAWTLDRGCRWEDDATSPQAYLEEEDVVYGGGGWKLSCDALWPERDKSLSFIGFTPIEAFGACTLAEGVTCTYDMLQTQTDIMYTDPQTDVDKVECGGIVIMPFRHALCQVDFEVKNRVAKNEEIIIKSIKIDGVKHTGSFRSLPEPTWTVEGEPVSLTFFEGNQYTRNVPDRIGGTWLTIPQNLDTNVSVEYEYRTAANTGFTATLKTCQLQTNLKPGRHYTYTLSVGIDDVKFLLEIIEDRFR